MYESSTAFWLNYNLDMPRPPITINGEVSVTTIPSLHEKMKQIIHEKNKPRKASTAIAADSVVNPLTAEMSSVI